MSILGTNITWEIVEEDMRKAFESEARRGPNHSYKQIGEGVGFLARIALLIFDWQGDGADKLPHCAVVKICSMERSGTDGDADMAAAMSDYELAVYSAADEGDGKIFAAVPKPKFYCGRKFDTGTGYFAIEFQDNVTNTRIWENLPDSVTNQALEYIADMTAKSLKYPELVERWDDPTYDKLWADLAQREKADERLHRLKGQVPEASDSIDILLAKTPRILVNAWARWMGNCKKPVFCHNDMWAPNLLHRDGKLVSVIDWQLCHANTPVEDLIFHLFSSLPPEEYVSKYIEKLRFFYDQLEAKSGGMELWDDFQQLVDDYEHRFITIILIMLAWFADARVDFLANPADNAQKPFDAKVVFLAKEVVRLCEKWYP
ncbi:unnamed protein product, partial [Mesorhabditis spiculigera]